MDGDAEAAGHQRIDLSEKIIAKGWLSLIAWAEISSGGKYELTSDPRIRGSCSGGQGFHKIHSDGPIDVISSV